MEIPFDLALAQAIAWCSPRADLADPSGSLRSSELTTRTVPALVRSRSSADPTLNSAAPVSTAADLLGGRLLVYFPDAELSDGAAEAESEGFFDLHNEPPWDTWVALLHDPYIPDESYAEYLVSWVPPVFLDLATAGIRVNPEACILWLEETEVPLVGERRDRGLMG